MALKLVTAPATEPLTLTEAKTHLRVDGSDDDTYITSLITVARKYCEGFQNRAYITQTYDLTLDAFPINNITLKPPPIQSVTSIKYYDTAGTEYTFDASNYIVDTDSEPGRISLGYLKTWPIITLQPINGVKIRFTAGYGDAASSVPETVKQAMLLLIGHWYENREPVITGMSVSSEIEFTARALLSMDRVVPV